MAFSTHTWVVGDAWPVTDANAFIRDAFISVRRYQNSSGQIFSGAATLFTTSQTQIGVNNFSLLSSTPDEAFRMVVVLAFQLNTTVGGTWPNNFANVVVKDQSGTVIGGSASGVDASDVRTLSAVAGANYSSGSNQGFSVHCTPLAATQLDTGWAATVFFSPQV